MSRLLLFGLAFSSLMLGGAGPLLAQTREVRNLATDTLQPANPKYYLPVSRIATATGQLLYVFILDGEVEARSPNLTFTWRNPMTLPRPKPLTIKITEIKWVRTDKVYYEPVHVLGQSYSSLAPRILAGPRVELFDMATPKKGVPIPTPYGGLIWTGAFSNNYNHTWFLRRPGLTGLVQVPNGKQFAPFLADYLADDPALAAAIRAGTEGYRQADVARLLETYNQSAGAPHQSPGP